MYGGLVLDVWGRGKGEEEWLVDEGAEEEEVSVGGRWGGAVVRLAQS